MPDTPIPPGATTRDDEVARIASEVIALNYGPEWESDPSAYQFSRGVLAGAAAALPHLAQHVTDALPILRGELAAAEAAADAEWKGGGGVTWGAAVARRDAFRRAVHVVETAQPLPRHVSPSVEEAREVLLRGGWIDVPDLVPHIDGEAEVMRFVTALFSSTPTVEQVRRETREQVARELLVPVLDVISGRVAHVYAGGCPEPGDPLDVDGAFDETCPACRAVERAARAAEAVDPRGE